MHSKWLAIAGVVGALGVILGAFGAHGLKERLSEDLLITYEVGVRYHMYHALALFATAMFASAHNANAWLTRACWAWLFGVVVFSGSLYALALTNILWLGAITPIGGVAFILGWAFVVAAGWKATRHSDS